MAFVPLSFVRPSPANQLRDAEHLAARLALRRTIRHFSPDPVPMPILDLAIAAAASAPSGAHQQPWTFVIVTDPAVKRKIRAGAEHEERENYENRFTEEWLEALAPFGTDWHKEFLDIAPALIVVFFPILWRQQAQALLGPGIRRHRLRLSARRPSLVWPRHPDAHAFPDGLLARDSGPTGERAPFSADLLIPVGYPAEGCQVPDLRRKALEEVRVRV